MAGLQSCRVAESEEAADYTRISFGPAHRPSTDLTEDRRRDYPAVTIGVAKRQGTNAVTVARGLERKLVQLQREIIHNIFELEDLTADEIMTSRHHIRAIEHDADRAAIAAQIEASPTSRYPVFVDDLDHDRLARPARAARARTGTRRAARPRARGGRGRRGVSGSDRGTSGPGGVTTMTTRSIR